MYEELSVIRCALLRVTEETVTKKITPVHMDAWLESLVTHVNTIVVLGVYSTVETVLMDVCRAGSGNNVTVSLYNVSFI